jgi:hypothetical protein
MTLWNYIVLGISFVLLAWLVWEELRRENRSRRVARVIASVLSVGALACLMLPLTYMRRVEAGVGGPEGVLLTEGYVPDSVRQFLRRNPGREVWEWPAGAALPAGNGKAMAGLAKLHVFGYGLTKEQWAGFYPPPVVFHPSPEGAGVTAADWKRKLVVGERVKVQGRFLNRAAGAPVKLVLTGMGTTLDSMAAGPDGKEALSPDGKADFELGTVPAQVGRSVYHLIALSGSDTLEQEAVPVEVVAGKALKILLLASSPDFENTFLMNWLSKNGHGVARRTAISRGKYDKAFVNMPEGALAPLSPSLLAPFDVVVADASALSSFGPGELTALRREVEEKGLGLILKVDSAGKGEVGIGRSGSGEVGAGVVGVAMAKDSSQRLYIKEKPGLQALLRDSLSRIVVGVSLYGAGKIVFTTLNTTYSQVLSGGGKQYAAYWSGVLRKAAREGEPGEEWRMEPALPRVGEPVRAWLQTTGTGLPQGYFGGEGTGGGRSVYLAQDRQLPFYWQGRYWPEEAGWQFARGLAGDTSWWYAWPAGGWGGVHRGERSKETLEYMAERKVDGEEGRSNGAGGMGVAANGGSVPGAELVAIPKGWFYVVFLLCVLFLWAERKMEGMNGRIVR